MQEDHLLPSTVKLDNRDVAPVATLQSRPRERQMYVTVLAPGACNFGTRDLYLLLGVSIYVSDRVRYF